MMTRKRLILLGTLPIFCIALIAAMSVRSLFSPGVTRFNFARIEEGMTYEEVSEIFGDKQPKIMEGRETWLGVGWKSESGAFAWITFHSNHEEGSRPSASHRRSGTGTFLGSSG
jgi:hypothetical protein